MTVNLFLFRGVVKILEGDLPLSGDGCVKVIHNAENGFIVRLGPLVNVQLAFQ